MAKRIGFSSEEYNLIAQKNQVACERLSDALQQLGSASRNNAWRCQASYGFKEQLAKISKDIGCTQTRFEDLRAALQQARGAFEALETCKLSELQQLQGDNFSFSSQGFASAYRATLPGRSIQQKAYVPRIKK